MKQKDINEKRKQEKQMHLEKKYTTIKKLLNSSVQLFGGYMKFDFKGSRC